MGLGLGLLWVLGIGAAVLITSGWRPENPGKMPPFGATVQQCEAALGHSLGTDSDVDELHRRSGLYAAKGWSVIVSFDEQGRAEQFIVSKAKFPVIPIPLMSQAEQTTLLDRFKGDSTWASPHDSSSGPTWTRADGQAYALYITSRRWMILMNYAGMDRVVKALPHH